MTKSKLSSRSRPLFGTLVRVQVDNPDLIEPIYQRLHEVESIFNFHDPKSELSRFNQDRTFPLSREMQELLRLAEALRQRSSGAFTPFVEEQSGQTFADVRDLRVDLGGLAKGYAVDEAVRVAANLHANAKGWIDAGGDVRFFGIDTPEVDLRLGEPPNVVTRALKLPNGQMAVASSAPGVAAQFGASRTSLRRGHWESGTTVTVVADTCMQADALTKVVLFGGEKAFQGMRMRATAMVFDRKGDLVEGYSCE